VDVGAGNGIATRLARLGLDPRDERGDEKMLRKLVIALATAGALGVAGSTGALADPHGHFGHFGGHFGGGHWGGPGLSFSFGAGPGYAYDYDYGCYQLHRVWTPFGWRLHRVYVCG
jgi:hypothetical protein